MDVGTVLTVIDAVRKAVAIYKRVEGLPGQMARLGKQMERINIFLVRLESFVKRKPTTASAALYPGQQDDLGQILADIQANAAKVYDLFERYEQGILSRSWDLEFRASWISHMWFSLVDNSPEKVQALLDDMDSAMKVLGYYLTLMAVEKGASATPAEAEPRTGRTLDTATAVATRPMASPSPSPAPSRRDYRILFVDAYNTDRSVVAEALLKLLGQLTLQSRGDWRIAEIRSAGFFVKRSSDCTEVIDGLHYSYDSFKKPWAAGGQSAGAIPLAAVFDNKWCNYPFKTKVRDAVTARVSRGLQKDMFARFDYIVVFTGREHDNMVKLKARFRASGGVARGKGQVVQLGTYLSRDGGAVREILYPPKRQNGSKDREEWNKKVAEIKTALKRFLEQEMKWQQPGVKEAGKTG